VDSFTGVFEARQGGALAMCRRRVTSSGIDFAGAMREPRRDGRPDVLPLSVQVSGHGVNPANIRVDAPDVDTNNFHGGIHPFNATSTHQCEICWQRVLVGMECPCLSTCQYRKSSALN